MAAWQPARAKLNLYLHVVGRRPDGYHLLDSLVAFVDIADRVRAQPAEELSLAITGPFASDLANDDPGNLVWRAAEALAKRAGHSPHAALTLEKNLPIASGIGGGSSDAAAMLKALDELWGLRLDEAALCAIAATLGADVPVCVAARASWLIGTGAEIAAAPALPAAGVVLVNPRIALPTPAVFAARQGPYSSVARFSEAPADAAALVALLAARRNDLTAAATALVPEIGRVLARLEAAEDVLLARMSGSGATCFALAADRAAAQRVASRLGAENPGWWIAAGELVG